MGYSQVHGIDYSEVFTPTMWLETRHLILSLLVVQKWKGRQVDFKDPDHPDWVCEVERSIYGLKQLPREWNLELYTSQVDDLERGRGDCWIDGSWEKGWKETSEEKELKVPIT
jgi:hypothetical protein